MSIDHYYAQHDGKWVCIDDYVFSDVRQEDDPDFRTDFWVDISHGRNLAMDERFYFSDRRAAIDFYLEGCQECQYFDDDGNPYGIAHTGLYLVGRLIHGLSIHGDPPGHEGEHLRAVMGSFCQYLEDREGEE